MGCMYTTTFKKVGRGGEAPLLAVYLLVIFLMGVKAVRNVMTHAQKTFFVFRRNERVH